MRTIDVPKPMPLPLFGESDLEKIAEAKRRMQIAGKELTNEAIEAEVKLMHEEKRLAEMKASLRSSPLFEPVCVLIHEKQEWRGTGKQFKDLLCSQFSDPCAKWYRTPSICVEQLKRVTPELRHEGIGVVIAPQMKRVTLTREAPVA